MPVSDALMFSVLNTAAGLVGGLIAAFAVDTWGRKNWFMLAFFGGAVPLLWLGYNAENLTADMVLIYSSICSFFSSSMLLSLYVYTPEIYPTRNRALGSSVATSWQRIGSIVGPMFVSMSLGGHGLGTVFLVFAAASLLAGIIAVFFMQETKKRVLEEMSP
jgi:putative MFS transporter